MTPEQLKALAEVAQQLGIKRLKIGDAELEFWMPHHEVPLSSLEDDDPMPTEDQLLFMSSGLPMTDDEIKARPASLTEEIEIIQAIDGKLIAKASFGTTAFTIELPTGFETWADDEQRAHLKRHVVPRLKYLVTRSRVTALRGMDAAQDPALQHHHFEQDGVTPTQSKARSGLRETRRRLKLAN